MLQLCRTWVSGHTRCLFDRFRASNQVALWDQGLAARHLGDIAAHGHLQTEPPTPNDGSEEIQEAGEEEVDDLPTAAGLQLYCFFALTANYSWLFFSVKQTHQETEAALLQLQSTENVCTDLVLVDAKVEDVAQKTEREHEPNWSNFGVVVVGRRESFEEL